MQAKGLPEINSILDKAQWRTHAQCLRHPLKSGGCELPIGMDIDIAGASCKDDSLAGSYRTDLGPDRKSAICHWRWYLEKGDEDLHFRKRGDGLCAWLPRLTSHKPIYKAIYQGTLLGDESIFPIPKRHLWRWGFSGFPNMGMLVPFSFIRTFIKVAANIMKAWEIWISLVWWFFCRLYHGKPD